MHKLSYRITLMYASAVGRDWVNYSSTHTKFSYNPGGSVSTCIRVDQSLSTCITKLHLVLPSLPVHTQ
eukprot:SAG31_NODE_2239_length_6115_cov_2.178191_1_plen_68_part_00